MVLLTRQIRIHKTDNTEEAREKGKVLENLLVLADEKFQMIDEINEPAAQCLKTTGQKMAWELRQGQNMDDKYLQGAFTSWLETMDEYEKDWKERTGREKQRKRLSDTLSVEGQPHQKTPCQSVSSGHESKSSHSGRRENDSQKSGQRNQPPISPLTKTNLDRHEETIQIQDGRQFGPTPQQVQKEQQMERTPYSVSHTIPFSGQQQKPKLINTEIHPKRFPQPALKKGHLPPSLSDRKDNWTVTQHKQGEKGGMEMRGKGKGGTGRNLRQPMYAEDPMQIMQGQLDRMKDKSDRSMMVTVLKETYDKMYQRILKDGAGTRPGVTLQQKQFAETRAHKIAMYEYIQN